MKVFQNIIGSFLPVALLVGCQTGTLTSTLAVQIETLASVEQTMVQSAGVTLAGTVLIPASANGTGAVMLPGSGPATRAMLRPMAEKLVEAGVTVLIFDKRGSGQSGGDWTKSSLDDLANDAIAAMNLLRARPQIDSVGLWAHSQGNWVAMRAAELGAQPAFVVAASGGGVSPRESERNAYYHRVLSATPEDRAMAMALVDSYFAYLSGIVSRETLNELVERAKTTDWYGSLGIDRVLVSEKYRAKWRWVADYDPADAADRRDFPVLVLLGGADHTIPLERTIVTWNSQLATGAAAGSRIEIFAGRDHHLRLANAGHGHGVTTDDEVWRIIDLWLGQIRTGSSRDAH